MSDHSKHSATITPVHTNQVGQDPHAVPANATQFQGQAIQNAVIGLVLAAATLLTVVLSFANFGSSKAHVVVALLIATLEALFVAFISMHLKGERSVIVQTLIITMLMFFVLLGL